LKIEWTDATWNPVAGCSIVSAGRKNCYAMEMARRLEAMQVEKYQGLTRKSGKRTISVQARDPQGAAFAMYIAVDSVAAAAERTTTRGGQVLLGPQERSPAAPELAIA
jgi:Protein of unknown function (DUF5131)